MTDLIIGRRALLTGLASAIAAPVIIKYANLMPVKVMKPLIVPVSTVIHPTTNWWDRYLVQAIDSTGETVMSFLSPVNDDTAVQVMQDLIRHRNRMLALHSLPALDRNLLIKVTEDEYPQMAGELGSYNGITFRES